MSSTALQTQSHALQLSSGTMVSHGANGLPGPGGGPRKPLPHIDDLTSSPVDCNMNLPLRKVLEHADNLLRQAQTDRDFGKPAIAFREYLHASIIAIKMVPRHVEYVSLQGGRADLKRMHTTLVKRVSEEHVSFDKIKKAIIEDNDLYNTRPASKMAARSQPQHQRQLSTPTPSPGPDARKRPPVQPKPQGLHGNAIRPGSSSGIPQGHGGAKVNDLAARFSNLNGPMASPGQDPRIRTHRLIQPGDDGQPGRPSLRTDLPSGMPKMPDAIYSPARGTISAEAAALPTSTPRGLYTRTGSSTPVINGSHRAEANKTDYFGSGSAAPSRSGSARPSVDIDEAPTISPMQLHQLMQAKTSILLIDVRSRDDFDEGHPFWQNIICVEPMLLGQETEDGDKLAERLSISPTRELALYEKRHEFDLVVIYDQSSEEFPRYINKESRESVLLQLQRILRLFSDLKNTKIDPKLLAGGIDAWVDTFGQNALLASQKGESATFSRALPKKPVSNKPQPTGRQISKSISQHGPRYVPEKDMPQSKVEAWNEQMQQDLDVSSIRRTAKEFMEKFPPVGEPQSMTSQGAASRQHHPHERDSQSSYSALTSTPQELTKPQPAAAKTNVSGLRTDNTDGSQVVPKPGAPSLGQQPGGHGQTGLENPHNWCYANSLLQAMRMSPGFTDVLSSAEEWRRRYPLPRKRHETTDNPQLMVRIISNLFHWMNSGSFQTMKAKTLMDYSLSLTSRAPRSEDSVVFGGNSQQDASEFRIWLMDALDQETNSQRNREGDAATIDMTGKTHLQAAYEWWALHSRSSRSIVDQYWRFLQIQTTTCSSCRNQSVAWDQLDAFNVSVPSSPPSVRLEDCLSHDMREEDIADYQCDKCSAKSKGIIKRQWARMPDLLCINLNCFTWGAEEGGQKLSTRVTWDLNSLNLERFCLKAQQQGAPPGFQPDDHFMPPFEYECYAVVIHQGSTLRSGHYYTFARAPKDLKHTWYKFNDRKVDEVKDPADAIFKDSGRPYLAFFKRKHK